MSDLHTLCKQCPNADGSVNYSDWHYCNKPGDIRQFTIMRHYSPMGGAPRYPKASDWCPYKDLHEQEDK